MHEIICFFKSLLMIKNDDKSYVGLTWLNTDNTCQPQIIEKPEKKKSKKDIKISDLMRKAN